MASVLVVFTAKGAGRIESEGGTASWALSPKSMRDCEYVVCTRNTDPAKGSEAGNQSTVPHGAAFLVGKVVGLEEVTVRNDRRRFRVLVSEIADVFIPDFWDGSRIPTRYLTIEDAETRRIDFSSLQFRAIRKSVEPQPISQVPASATTALPGFSINEAKAGLALRFGVSTDEIDIVIRG